MAQHSQRLTYEAAERLRRQVMVSDRPIMNDICVISGKSESADGEIRGSILFQTAIGKSRYWGVKGWIWRKRNYPPTEADRASIPDFPGIGDGDPITFGHLQALGIAEAAD
jgi:hypothetical protein